VIIHDLGVVSVAVAPGKAKAPAIVDPNTMLALSVTVQGFQSISRRRHQILQLCGAVQLSELPSRDLLDGLKASARLAAVETLGFGAPKRSNHQ